ncbi:hypothetical protein CPB86DRAFT_782545 [Serendipita vermifera]|nr:hypothetical protein CPB86DRAFT_782545 [Serendipita vermifera]
MVKSVTKLIYKPDSQSTDEYILFVDATEYQKRVNGAYDVFFSTQGSQGKLGKASKQQLENVFGSKREDDIAEFMLEKGVLQRGDRIGEGGASTNYAR